MIACVATPWKYFNILKLSANIYIYQISCFQARRLMWVNVQYFITNILSVRNSVPNEGLRRDHNFCNPASCSWDSWRGLSLMMVARLTDLSPERHFTSNSFKQFQNQCKVADFLSIIAENEQVSRPVSVRILAAELVLNSTWKNIINTGKVVFNSGKKWPWVHHSETDQVRYGWFFMA